MKTTAVAVSAAAASAVAMLAAGCGTQQARAHADAPRATAPRAHVADATVSTLLVASTSPGRCTLRVLSVRLGPAGAAAGSTYRPIVFTNTGAAACTLRGYPGVSYVAPATGRQVGAAAGRDDVGTIRAVTLAPGGHAAALLQLVNYLNYPAARCTATKVSGLRVYPPGSTAAAYVAFARIQRACSSDVAQLSVRPVVRGSSGQ